MNHYTWTYLGDNGRNYRVGLLHSAKTGHLVIYIGSKIVQIDFKVFESKEYSFFIEEELVHIKLERKGNEMYFYFNIDKEVDTPRNRYRHKLERKYFYQLLIFLGVLALVVTGVVILGKNASMSEKEKLEKVLAKGSQETVGRVLIKKLEHDQSQISYQFVAGNQTITAPSLLQSESLILLENPMPLVQGDEFQVRYSTKKPKVNEMLFGEPTPRQVELYKQRAAAKHNQLNPNAPPGMTDCFVKTAYEYDGLQALADIYFQDFKPAYNLEHNHETYGQLIYNQKFLEKLEANCGELKPQN